MGSDGPLTKKLNVIRKDMLRGDSLFGLLILVVVSVFLVNLVTSVWNNVRFQRDLKEQTNVQNAKAIGGLLARTAEALISTGELSMLRRTVVETCAEHDWKACRVVLSNGETLADSEPSRITAIELPDTWEGAGRTYSEKLVKNVVHIVFPLSLPGRGGVSLEISAPVEDSLQSGLAPQTAQLAITCLALALMLLVHRHTRFRLKAIGAIHDVLLAVNEDTADLTSLALDPRLGEEAVVWNKLLGDKQSEGIRNAIQQVRESMHERSEASEELLAMFDAVPYGLVLVNESMRIEHVNGAAAILLQVKRGELIHADVSEVIAADKVTEAIRATVGNPASERGVIEMEGNGSATASALRFTTCPIRHTDAHLALVLIEDITQQKLAGAASKSFLAKAAHELRTPLTNIRLYVEDALELCGAVSAETSKCLNVINDESRRLDRTVSEILSISEIEAGSLALRQDDVHVEKLLQQLKADHEPQAREKQIDLAFDLSPKLPVMQTDRDKLSLVLHNLLGNALKYTQPHGRVLVSAAVEAGHLTIAVSDTGIGIVQEEAEKVFEKFYRSQDPRMAGIEGSGLGLAICREVARLQGGDVTVESEVDKGSTFTLTLPLCEEVV